MFEMLAIEDADDTSAVTNRAPLLECACRYGNGSSSASQNASEGFLGQRHIVGCRTIVSHQQPSAEALLDRVEFVAHGGLRNLSQKGIRIMKEDSMQRFAAFELFSQ
jgi:hypothetical protein